MTASTTEHRESRRHVRLIVGAALALVSLAVLLGGGLALGAASNRDADGFYTTGSNTLATPTRALVSERLDLGTDGPDWLFRKGRLGTIRVSATAVNGKPTFVGVGPAQKVDEYLRGVAVDEVVDFDIDPFSVSYARHAGSAKPLAPAAQTFWATTATGSGKQTLMWPVRKGAWAVVVMNADASAGIRTDVAIGAKVPVVFWLAVAITGFGGVLAVAAGAVLYLGLRRPRAAHDRVGAPAGVGGAQ